MHAYNHEWATRPVKYLRPKVLMPAKANEHKQIMMINYLADRGLSAQAAFENGWYSSISAGDSYARIVIPASLGNGEVYWQARSMEDGARVRYQSPKASREDALVIMWPRDDPKRIVVVEGPMDALAAVEVASTVGVALMGNNPPVKALDRLGCFLSQLPVLCIADSDSVDAMSRIATYLAAVHLRKVKVVSVSPYKDLASVPKNHRSVYAG